MIGDRSKLVIKARFARLTASDLAPFRERCDGRSRRRRGGAADRQPALERQITYFH